MLISSKWFFLSCFVWSFYPVPTTISMSSKTPCIFKSRLVLSPTTKCNHHTGGWTLSAQSCGVVSSHTGYFISTNFELSPWKWSFVHIETPYVIYWLSTIEWPYLRPGVFPTTGTIIHWAAESPFLRSSKYKSSEASEPPPVAPPYTTI